MRQRGLRNRTTRLVLVPLLLLVTPQQLAVLVNSWALISTSTGSSPAAIAAGNDDFLEPHGAAADFADLERDVSAGLQRRAGSSRQLARRRTPATPRPCLRHRHRHAGGIDAAEPAAQPVVGSCSRTTSRNGGEVTTRSTESRGDRRRVGRAPVRSSALGHARRRARSSRVHVRAAAIGSSSRMIAARRARGGALLAPLVDLRCDVDRHRLVRRQRVDREEPGRMAGEPVDRHHPDPAIDAVERSAPLALEQVRPQRADLPQRLGVIEDEQVLGRLAGVGRSRRPRAAPATLSSVGGASRGRSSTRAQRVDVAAARHAPQQRRFDERRAAAHERVVDARRPAAVSRSMKKRGSCGLKQAR